MRAFCLAILFACAWAGADKDPCLDQTRCYWTCKLVDTICRQTEECNNPEVPRLERRVRLLTAALEKWKALSKDIECKGITYNSHCYFLVDDQGSRSMLPYVEAQQACNQKGAKLVEIDNPRLYSMLYEYAENNARDFLYKGREFIIAWTGASYVNSTVYLGNRLSDFVRWARYHPFNVPNRNRIAMVVSLDPKQRHMFDATATTKFYPFCQKQLKKTSS